MISGLEIFKASQEGTAPSFTLKKERKPLPCINKLGITLKNENDYYNFIMAEEYKDFLEFLEEELGIEEFNEIWNKFHKK